MVKIFLLIILLFLTVMGICELIYIFRMLFYFPNTKTKNYCLVFLKKDFALKQLNYYYQKMKWNGDMFAHSIIAVIDDIDALELRDCSEFVKDKNCILCTFDCLLTNTKELF